MKAIVIAITPYKEKDGIIEVVSSENVCSVLVKGLFKGESKNIGLNNVLTLADIELIEGNYKYPILKTSTVIFSPLKQNSDLTYLSCLLIIAEASKNLLQNEEKKAIYPYLLNALKALKNNAPPLIVVLTYFGIVFKLTGYALEVNGCVFCHGKKKIIAFSFPDGGFVCEKCFSPEMKKDLTPAQMKLLRAVILNEKFDLILPTFNQNDGLVLLKKFHAFVFDYFGVNLKSDALLFK